MCIVCFKLEQLDLAYKCSVLKLFPYILCFCPNLHIFTNKLLIIFNTFIFNIHTIVISYLPTTIISLEFSSVQSLTHVQLFVTPQTAAHSGVLSITNSQSLLKLMSIESVISSNHLILCCPLLLLPSIFPASGSFQMSQLFASGGQSVGSFSFNISPSNEHPGLICFRMDWLNLLTVQGTLKSLPQLHSSKASILRCSAFFTV